MDIPSYLEAQIQDGKVVLFLGAGASRDASDKNGNPPPTGAQLASLLSKKFLGGKYSDYPLHQVGEYAISESDLVSVQEYIRGLFEGLEPSASYKLMCKFIWSGIATTNYDRLVERAYEITPGALQVPIPFIENGDRIEDKLRDSRNVPLLKLHGCITRITNVDCPLILTTDQYVSHRRGRSRVFDHLKNNWAFERPILFVGYQLQDPDLRAMLLEVTEAAESRPRYYAVLPNVDDIERRFWETKKVTLIQGTFHQFLTALNDSIPTETRVLATVKTPSSYPIAEKFKSKNVTLSASCRQFLDMEVDYVKAITATEHIEPRDFYKGLSPGWSAVEQNLDCPRTLGDTILSDNFLATEVDQQDRLEVLLIKAHAGAGKTILLQRLAWDAARDYDRLCVYLRPHGVLNTAALQELLTLCGERIYLFVDNAADHIRELVSLVKNIGPEGKNLTVIAAERINEWNVQGGVASPYVTQEYELAYLSSKEIDRLLGLLERHKALGTLERLDHKGRHAAFQERAGRQLLVALHEATLGKRFEEIIEDEYANITPDDAKRVYLSICLLNRLNVSVRAGLIARMHGISYEDFERRLFKPLEHVVLTERDPIIRDYVYRARHPHIAQIVFERILTNQEERYDLYLRCLRSLNIDYSSDRVAFAHMTRGRALLSLFSNHDLIKGIYQIAQEQVVDDPHLLHQMGLYEMHRPNGNLQESARLFSEAQRLAPHDSAIKHSSAELYLKRAEGARTSLEKSKYLEEAQAICNSLTSGHPLLSYGHHTAVKIGLTRLRDQVRDDNIDEIADTTIEKSIRQVEQVLADAHQRFPGDSYLLDAEAQLALLLSDSKRALRSLENAFNANPRSPFLAIRLAQQHIRTGSADKAHEVLQKALGANPGDQKLHYAYANFLRTTNSPKDEELLYHLQRSFTPGDTNYDAQLLYGRQLFISGDLNGAKKVFEQLGKAKVGPELRSKLLYPIDKTYRGTVSRLEATYFFIARDGHNDWIFCNRSNVDEVLWKQLVNGSRVAFRIGFNFRGAGAHDVRLEN